MRRYSQARAIADKVIRQATVWLDRPDPELLQCLPTADVPRAFNVGTAGCPTCGKAIYTQGGTYPWKLDLAHPFQVECPICAGRFPDNDFASYYANRLQDRQFLTGTFADDGWGWVDPNGQRYWFVAYANHWNWRNSVLPAIRNLARAYLLTEDTRFAHKSAVMLYRVAQVYPAMDYHVQSRYGQLQAARGARYEGKTLNHIWETTVLHMLAESYDAVWETVDGDQALQTLTGKTGAQIRAGIEANLLEEGIDAVLDKKISGNYGMHQRALIFAALARGAGPVDAWLDGVLHQTDPNIRHLGIDYALYNLVYRDGIPYETSPGYNLSWVRNLTEVAETLAKANRNLYANPKMRLLYRGVMDLVNIGQHTPALGDSGSVYGGCVGRDPFTFQAAWRAYGDDRTLRFLGQCGAVGESGFSSYETLFQPLIAATPEAPRPAEPRLLDGYGMALLNNRNDSISLSLYYGTRGGHGHFDRMHFDLFAAGLPMTPDLGYPDFMNAYVPGIFTWSKNTISHNTVTVNASRQDGNDAGTVRLFACGPFARVVDVNAPGTYAECTTYRRRIVMVDVDDERSYFVDWFAVDGGRQHDYSLHGPPGEFRVLGGQWTEPATGTLAGADVAVGQIYDDPAMAAPGYTGSYSHYRGSGFQHLQHIKRREGGDWCAEWRHEKNSSARLRVRIVDQPNQEIVLADAQVSPVKQKQRIGYVIARRTLTDRASTDLRSRFVSVLEPFDTTPFIQSVRVEAATDGGRQLVIERTGGWTDRVTLDTPPRADPGVLSADFPSVRVETAGTDGKITRVFTAGPWVADPDRANPDEAHPNETHPSKAEWDGTTLQGRVVRVDPNQGEIHVRTDQIIPADYAAALVSRIVHFRNSVRQTAHTVMEARLDGTNLVLRTRDALLVGRLHVTSITPTTMTTDARFQFPSVYRGTYLTGAQLTGYYPIRSAQADAVTLAEPLPRNHPFVVGNDAWIVDVGPNDQFVVPSVQTWKKD